MGVDVERIRLEHGSRNGLTTLVQQFVFRSGAVSAQRLASVLVDEPLVGEGSVFGDRPGREEPAAGGLRVLRGFSPAPGFRFDVELRRVDDMFVLTFSQPDRSHPYLEGQFVWILEDRPDGAVLDEQINTERALAIVDEPLSGTRPSLRRWLFFRVGHARVARDATRRLAVLAGD